MNVMILGMGFLACGWREHRCILPQRLHWLSLLIAVSGAVVTLLLWRMVGAQEQAYVQQTIHQQLLNTRKFLAAELETRLLALVRMANRWEHSGQPREDAWEADANLYLQHYQGSYAIGWVDPAF